MTSSTARRSTVLITGASRGLGAELARIYDGDGWRVIACARVPHAGASDRLALDVADPASIDALGQALQGVAIDVLINNAAVRGDTGGLATLKAGDFLDVIRVNTLAPLLLTRALLANLRAGERRVVANISSRAGSLAEGTLDDDDGDYAYRCSKAALNMATVKLAQDLKGDGISVLSLHPGWVQTDMGGSEAVVSVADSAAGLKAIIDRADLAASGSFRAYDGRRVSW
ncbi:MULTISPECIES: SDR family oxidoreductase [unclassified Ensifer]|uniref:SDR family oxidoreductase n=1 Tax=unclassified Ensifer TaxID=2633371 RepID=UPI000813BE2D|nr:MULTISPECIES: SDR family oxidoreductase [unclassified Ensifer]OCP02734.1 oxidoreductase [Ensifer sp. LC14]OCP13635.1 oxidoreductase [Ensifer sp. LC13]OCP14295.1 oxidoreductase [Ensifer sp. LC11]OCP28997.1 oxidoreductase [Ensifer sp. LC499]